MALTLTTTKTSATYGDYGFTRSGHKVSKAIYDPVQMAAERVDWGPVDWLQGGLNPGGVAASAATHAGLDVGDIRTRGHTRAEQFEMCSEAMRCGVILFIRGVVDNMDPHFHGVSIPADQAHRSAYQQLYSPSYGYRNGGAGLAGAPGARWWGPARQDMISWERSNRNPSNQPGWFVVDPEMVTTVLVGLTASGDIIPGSGREAGARIYAKGFDWARISRDGLLHKYAVEPRTNARYNVSYLNRSRDQTP